MSEFTVEAFTLLGVGLFGIGLRTYSRVSKVGFKSLQADDYLMLLAAGVYSVETVLAYTVGAYWHGLANNGMTDEQRAALDPKSEEYRLRVNGSKTQIAGWSTYTLLLWILKSAVCTFYLRLTDGLNVRNRILFGFALIFSSWLAVLFSILLSCRPLSKNWQINPNPGTTCQPAVSRVNIFVTLILNVATDVYLLSIPVPMIFTSNLRPLKKLGLIVLFSGGVFVTMAGILRCVLILRDPVNGAQQAGSWACRETFVAVITSNLPMIFPLFRRLLGPVITTLRRSTRNTGQAPAGSHGPLAEQGRQHQNNRGPRTAYPLTNFSFEEDAGAAAAAAPSLAIAVKKDVSVEVSRNATTSTSSGSGLETAGDPYLKRVCGPVKDV